MKKILGIFLISLLAACGGDDDGLTAAENTAGTSGGAGSSEAGVENGAQPGDPAEQARFLADSYQSGLDEIALAEVATEQATDDNTRQLAQRLLTHHRYLNQQIQALATQQGATLPDAPSAEATQALQTLSGLSGPAFDRAYATQEATRHQQMVVSYGERAEASTSASASSSTDASDGTQAESDVQTFASNALPALQLHLQAATALSGALDPAAFLTNLYQQGLAEIALSQLALDRSDNAEVQAFAQRMIDDHTAANQQIATQAQANAVPLPDEPNPAQQALAEDLAALSGVDFDKAYMNHNVLGHEVAVAQAEAQAAEGVDAGVAALAATLEPTLRMHREQAQTLYEQIEPTPLFASLDTGIGQVLLSQLALQLSGDDDVRQLADRLFTEYSAANEQARQVARQNDRGVPPEPSVEAATGYVALAQLSADAFDSQFLERNTEILEAAAQMLGTAQDDVAAAQARIDALLPTLRAQLDAANQLLQQSASQPATEQPAAAPQ